jgi:HEAT repeat protein
MNKVLLTAALIVTVSAQNAAAGGLGVPRKEDMPKYLKMLQSSAKPKDRAFAAEQIGKRGQIQVNDVKNAIEPLMAAVKKDKAPEVRSAAALALGNIATEPNTVVPVLEAALKDKTVSVNLAAVNALGAYGPQARSAVPALRKFAQEKKDKKIMRLVNQTIKQINAKVQ